MMSKWILRGVAIASVLVSYNCRSRNRDNDTPTPAPTDQSWGSVYQRYQQRNPATRK